VFPRESWIWQNFDKSGFVCNRHKTFDDVIYGRGDTR
jgi:hypothetical protein